jgi:hypothetical protein
MNSFSLFIILSICLVPFTAIPQEVLLKENVVKEDTTVETFGPNRKHFVHPYALVGFVIDYPSSKKASTNYGSSFQAGLGVRYKLKLSSVYSAIADLQYNTLTYNLSQTDDKTVPTTQQHDNESFNLDHFSLSLHNRFNFGERGNIVGTFLDLGAYGNWSFMSKHVYKNKYDDPDQAGAKKQKVINKNLTYMRPFHYGFAFRFGINQFVLYGRYRFSDLFKNNTYTESRDFAELPRVIVGLQIGFHR